MGLCSTKTLHLWVCCGPLTQNTGQDVTDIIWDSMIAIGVQGFGQAMYSTVSRFFILLPTYLFPLQLLLEALINFSLP